MSTILVVDDIAANRELLVTLLRFQGHRLMEATNGSEAMTAAVADRPDLVITDVLMPVMDGYELVRQLRVEPATRDIPVVFYTAHYGEREARAFALANGVSFVLTKPVEPEQVLSVVARALTGQSEGGTPALTSPLTSAFDREHLRLLTDKLSEKAEDLSNANARLRAIINIGLELASERDADRLLQSVCVAARDLFGASYVTLGIFDREASTLRRLFTDGTEAVVGFAIGDEVRGVLRTVVMERQTVRGDNPGGDPTRLQLPAAHPVVHTFLVAPLASPAHVYGWIFLGRINGASFLEDDEALVRALAGQAGRIYENGYFYRVAKAERDRAQQYLDTADVILLALDLSGRVTLINRKGSELLGFSERELLGRDWIDTCVPERAREGLRRKFADLIAGSLTIVENAVLTRSGEERLIEWRNQVLRDQDGHPTGMLSSGTDITEQKRAVDALRTAEERMRFALQSADVGIWDMDYSTGVLQWSETIEAHYGLAPGAFDKTFESFLSRVHPDDRERVVGTLNEAMKSGSDFSVEHRAIWPNGTERRLAGAGRILLNDRGLPVRGVGISMDVTERRTLEAQFQQAQKMEAVGRLAGGVAHDFNNLLTATLGYCELLLDEVREGDPLRADIVEIQKAGTRAAGLTRQLLAFSRKQIIEPKLLDLNTIVADMRGMLARLIGEDVKVVLALQPALKTVRADHGQVEQVIMNLAVNARDAMSGGGTLTIETANVELDEHHSTTHPAVKSGPYVALTVTDTGTGMSAEVQARLFEPFFTTKEPGKGTGLGMATVYGIVTRAEGAIGISSEVGSGTSFKIYFPAMDSAETAMGAAQQAAQRPVGTQTILVVEDEDGLRELARRLLKQQGYKVLLAANATEAIRLFEKTPSIDVLLTDVVMPGASGPDLTRHLIQQRPALKVVYMSGYTEDAIVHHGVLAPGIAFLHKPFTSATLGNKIREVLNQ